VTVTRKGVVGGVRVGIVAVVVESHGKRLGLRSRGRAGGQNVVGEG